PRGEDAAESHVRRRAIRGSLAPGAGEISGAILVGAEERPAALDALGDARLIGVVARCGPLGVVVWADLVSWAIPVGAPFPDVAGHVEEAIAVGGEARHGCRAGEPVVRGVPIGEVSLPDVRRPRSGRAQLVAPDIAHPGLSAPRGAFPLSLGRQPLARPPGKRHGILPADLDDRITVLALDRGLGPLGMPPVGAGHVSPPDQ